MPESVGDVGGGFMENPPIFGEMNTHVVSPKEEYE